MTAWLLLGALFLIASVALFWGWAIAAAAKDDEE